MRQATHKPPRIRTIATFAAAVAAGCCIAVAFAGAAAVGHAAPAHRVAPAATEVVRLEPVVVTIPRARFDEQRRLATDRELARANDARKATRG